MHWHVVLTHLSLPHQLRCSSFKSRFYKGHPQSNCISPTSCFLRCIRPFSPSYFPIYPRPHIRRRRSPPSLAPPSQPRRRRCQPCSPAEVRVHYLAGCVCVSTNEARQYVFRVITFSSVGRLTKKIERDPLVGQHDRLVGQGQFSFGNLPPCGTRDTSGGEESRQGNLQTPTIDKQQVRHFKDASEFFFDKFLVKTALLEVQIKQALLSFTFAFTAFLFKVSASIPK